MGYTKNISTMAKQTTYIIGNWKMHLTVNEASLFVHSLDSVVAGHNDVEIVLAPGFLALQPLSMQADHRRYKLAAQNLYWRDEGAYTGEVSAHQLRGLVKYAIIGHSERRNIFGERGRDIGRKVQAAVRHGIRPILCVGESALERSDGETKEVLHDQLVGGLSNLTSDDMAEVIIAYEPIWAIGSGKSAAPADVEQVAEVIRDQIRHLFGAKTAERTPVLYGGSVSQDNATGYLTAKGINGLLVGGASLDPQAFAAIVDMAHKGK